MKNGFTLLELVVVLAIMVVLTAIAIPPLSMWVARNKVKNFAYDLSKNINYARNLSKKDGKRLIVVIVKANLQPQSWTGNSSIDPVYYFIYEDNNNNMIYDKGIDRIIAYSTNTNGIYISRDSVNKVCMNSAGRCIVFFPVGLPLIGASSFSTIAINSKGYNGIEYDVNLMGITGVSEVKLIK